MVRDSPVSLPLCDPEVFRWTHSKDEYSYLLTHLHLQEG